VQATLLQADPLLHLLATAIYGIAAALSIAGVLANKPSFRDTSRALALGALVVHTLALATRWLGSGHGPYVSKYELLSAYAWASIALFMLWSHRTRQVRTLSVIVYPVVLVLMGVALYTGPEVKMLPPSFRGIWLALHVAFYIVAFATGLLATAASSAYVLKRTPDTLVTLPDRVELDRIAYRQAGLAFAFWGVGIATGAVWAYYSWGRFWGWDPVETWSLVTWLAFGIYLHLRRFHGWKGTRAAWVLLGCFVLALISLFGISLLTSTLHSGYFA
jgi:cytochrome c-type biogenesis protein CcsB